MDAWTNRALRRLKVQYRSDPHVYAALCAVDGALASSSERTKIAPQPATPHAGLMTSQQFAKLAGLTVRAVQKACQQGRIRAIRVSGIWLIDAAELARWEGRH